MKEKFPSDKWHPEATKQLKDSQRQSLNDVLKQMQSSSGFLPAISLHKKTKLVTVKCSFSSTGGYHTDWYDSRRKSYTNSYYWQPFFFNDDLKLHYMT